MAAIVKPANQKPSGGDAHGQPKRALERPRDPHTQRFAKTHGVSEFVRRAEAGVLDLRHRHDQQYLALQRDLLADLGSDLSAQERQLTNRAVFAGSVCEAVEGYVRSEGCSTGTRG